MVDTQCEDGTVSIPDQTVGLFPVEPVWHLELKEHWPLLMGVRVKSEVVLHLPRRGIRYR